MKRQTMSWDSRKNNPVAKHAHQFNRSNTFIDRKKAAKRGYNKFKQNLKDLRDDSKANLFGFALLSS